VISASASPSNSITNGPEAIDRSAATERGGPTKQMEFPLLLKALDQHPTII
jgi:hypothetical protein